jgi:hypothetical protein
MESYSMEWQGFKDHNALEVVLSLKNKGTWIGNTQQIQKG